jgi:putative ABC transport system permease protein
MTGTMLFDTLREILSVIKTNKLRTAVTSFSVAWGIFMLIVLLGSGKGVENAQKRQFTDAMHNSLWLFAGNTTLAHQGLRPGRRITMRNSDHDIIAAMPGVDLSSSRYRIPGDNVLAYKGKYNSFEIRSAKPSYNKIEYINLLEGRFLNEDDSRLMRKVAVISTDVRDYFFGQEPAIGKYILANGINFLVVGLFEDKDRWDNNRCIYVPVEVAQRVFSGGDVVSLISVTMGNLSLQEGLVLVDAIREDMGKRHRFDKDDRRALHISNNLEGYHRVLSSMKAISLFIWVIGIGTIVAGIVGISNIMLISVKERRREIGIRKAIGAKPVSVIFMIMAESVILTSAAGYIGLVAGVGCLHLMGTAFAGSDVFTDPQADIGIAVKSIMLLVAAGAAAGYFPARAAAKVLPVEALRSE